MKLKSGIDYSAFLLAVKRCKGEVTFHTIQGDMLNLKSTLSEYLFATAALTSDLLDGGHLVLTQTEDQKLLADFLEA